MTRFVAKQLATAHWYDISAAKRDLGYNPSIDTDEGLKAFKLGLNNKATTMSEAENTHRF